MRTYIAYQGVLLRSVPVKWKKKKTGQKEKLYHDAVLTEALVHPAGNSDDRTALDNIIC